MPDAQRPSPELPASLTGGSSFLKEPLSHEIPVGSWARHELQAGSSRPRARRASTRGWAVVNRGSERGSGQVPARLAQHRYRAGGRRCTGAGGSDQAPLAKTLTTRRWGFGARTGVDSRGYRVQEGRARLSALVCADTFELTDRLFDLGWVLVGAGVVVVVVMVMVMVMVMMGERGDSWSRELPSSYSAKVCEKGNGGLRPLVCQRNCGGWVARALLLT